MTELINEEKDKSDELLAASYLNPFFSFILATLYSFVFLLFLSL
jgi:hypothetical protein